MRVSVYSRFIRCVSSAGLLLLPVTYGAFVVWQEVQFRKHFAGPPQVVEITATPSLREALDGTAVASVLGLMPETAQQVSGQSLKLLASFVASKGLSKAILADAEGQRLYRVGELLPGGSTLRRVGIDHAVLWNKGHEERLMLQSEGNRFPRRLESRTQSPVPATSMRFLRPLAGQPE